MYATHAFDARHVRRQHLQHEAARAGLVRQRAIGGEVLGLGGEAADAHQAPHTVRPPDLAQQDHLTRHLALEPRLVSVQRAAAAAFGAAAQICYAVKANSNIAVLKTLGKLGAGADIVSEGELRRALAAGIPASKIVFSGVGKTAREIADAALGDPQGRWVEVLVEVGDAAEDDDTLERLATMADVVPVEVHERGWQWRPVDKDTAFAPPFGTIRKCRVCGCLVAGGPTACARCARNRWQTTAARPPPARAPRPAAPAIRRRFALAA
mgnify:CR=1 FL=1